MTVNVVALLTTNDNEPQALAHYFSVALPLLEKVGAKILQRYAVSEVVIGREPAKSVLIVEYPDRAAVDAVFASADYEALKPIRDRAFLEYSVSVIEADQ